MFIALSKTVIFYCILGLVGFTAYGQNCVFTGPACNITLPVYDGCGIIAELLESKTRLQAEAKTRLDTQFYANDETDNKVDENHTYHSNWELEDNTLHNSIRSHLKSRTDQIAELSKETAVLRNELQKITAQHNHEMDNCRKSVEQLEDKLHSAEAVNHELVGKLSEAEKAITIAEHEIELLVGKLAERDQDLADMKSRQEACEAQLEEERVMVSTQGTHIKELIQRNYAEKRENEKLTEELLRVVTQKVMLQQSHDSLAKEKQSFHTELVEKDYKILALQENHNIIEDRVSELNNELSIRNRDLKRFGTQIRSCVGELTSQRLVNKETGRRLAHIANDLKRKTHQLRRMQLQNSILSKDLEMCLSSKTAGYCDMEMVNGTAQETDTCWFRREESDDYFWKVADSSQLANTPSTDHTCGSKTGHFLYIDLGLLYNGQAALLTSLPFYYSGGPQCFTFWYNVHYDYSFGRLQVQAVMLTGEMTERVNVLVVWQDNRRIYDEWIKAYFEVPAHVTSAGYKLQFVAEANGSGYIAVDDIALIDNSCLG